MKNNVLKIATVMFALLMCAGCTNAEATGNNVSSSTDTTMESSSELTFGGDDYLEYYTCKVVEVRDDNTVLIQLAENRYDYKAGDKIYVHYDEAVVQDKRVEYDGSEGLIDSDYKPVVGDEVFVQWYTGEVREKIDGYDYRENHGPVIKYVTVDESSK